jgi:DNA-binding transcriptional LysR family regulator
MFDWSDIRCFLAVARSGSTLTASKALKVSQPTVARRIAALEEALGLHLFERRAAGYRLTADGQALLAGAEAMEHAADGVESTALAMKRAAAGVVRLTTNEFIAQRVMGPLLRDFRERYPDIQVDLISDERHLDLAAGEADIALRSSPNPPTQNDLVCRRIVDAGFRPFCSRAYAERHGRPQTYDDLRQHLLIGGEGELMGLPAMQWLDRIAPDAKFVARCNSLVQLQEYVRAGVGVSILPNEANADMPEIIPCGPSPPELTSHVWLITHERLRNEPRVRSVLDFISAYVAAYQARLRAIAAQD